MTASGGPLMFLVSLEYLGRLWTTGKATYLCQSREILHFATEENIQELGTQVGTASRSSSYVPRSTQCSKYESDESTSPALKSPVAFNEEIWLAG
jgi:hypothetical protein